MFTLNEKYEVDRQLLKSDFLRYSPSEISTIYTPNAQIYHNTPRKDSLISLLKSYIDLNFDIIHAATNNRYVDGNDIGLANLRSIPLFTNYSLPA